MRGEIILLVKIGGIGGHNIHRKKIHPKQGAFHNLKLGSRLIHSKPDLPSKAVFVHALFNLYVTRASVNVTNLWLLTRTSHGKRPFLSWLLILEAVRFSSIYLAMTRITLDGQAEYMCEIPFPACYPVPNPDTLKDIIYHDM